MVDLDPHGSLTSYFGLDPDSAQASAYTLFENRASISRERIHNLIFETPFSKLSLLPASTALATLERQSIGDGLGLVVGKSLALVANDFDLVIVDCPPQLGVLMVNALAACDILIIPVQTEFLAIKGLERILHTLKMLRKSRQRELVHIIVPTMFDRRTQACVGSLRTIRNTYGDDVWVGRVPIDTRFRDASKAGIPPSIFQSDTRGVAAYRNLYEHICGRVAPVDSQRLDGLRPGGAR